MNQRSVEQLQNNKVSRIGVFLGTIGRNTRIKLAFIADLLGLLVVTIKQSGQLLKRPKRRVFWMLFKRQFFNYGYKATYINCSLAMLIGFIVAAQLPSITNNRDAFVEYYVLFVVLELAPLVSGIVLIARSATAITAEISLLQLNNEFEVLRSQGVNPLFVFMLPVFYAFPLSLLFMFVYFNFTTLASTWLYFKLFSSVDVGFMDFVHAVLNSISTMGLFTLIIKGLVGGIIIALISVYSGWQVRDRFTEMSKAISNSTTSLLLMYFALNMTRCSTF